MRKMILLGLNKLEKNRGVYSYCLEINSYWLEYMHNKFGMVDFKNLPKDSTDSQWEIVSQKLMKLDYHGARITVIKSKCPSVVGLEGIIMQDTKNTFRLVSKGDIIRSKSAECHFSFTKTTNTNLCFSNTKKFFSFSYSTRK